MLSWLFEASVRAVANYGMRKNSPKVSKAGMCNHPTHTPCDLTSDEVITTRLKASLCWFTIDTVADDKNNSPLWHIETEMKDEAMFLIYCCALNHLESLGSLYICL